MEIRISIHSAKPDMVIKPDCKWRYCRNNPKILLKMSDPIYVAFATQKGGVGKSTLTALVASYLHYVEGVDVMAVDCDSTQHSLNVYREHDLVVTKENPALKKLLFKFYTGFKKKPYDIVLTCPSDALAVAEETIKGLEKPPQVVFFDITGTINDIKIVDLVANMDYIFVPITTETGEMASSITFANNVLNRMITTGRTNIKGMHLIWNKIITREKTRLCEIIDRYIAKLGLDSLETVLVKSNKFEKDGREAGNSAIFRSTLLPPDKRLLKGTNLDTLVAEIRKIINV